MNCYRSGNSSPSRNGHHKRPGRTPETQPNTLEDSAGPQTEPSSNPTGGAHESNPGIPLHDANAISPGFLGRSDAVLRPDPGYSHHLTRDQTVDKRHDFAAKPAFTSIPPSSDNKFKLSPISKDPTLISKSSLMEVLPAMSSHTFTGSLGMPSHGGLPSLHDSGLKTLLEEPPPQTDNLKTMRASCVNTMLSPPDSSGISTFQGSPSCSGSSQSPSFSHGHTSPANSNPSPRDPCQISTLIHLDNPVPSAKRLSIETSASTSANGSGPVCTGLGSRKVELSAPDRRHLDDFPPQSMPPTSPHHLSRGGFHCKHKGCKATPFQTLYLLQ